MKKVVLIYNDDIEIPSDIKTVIGKSSFGEIILKRKTNYERIKEIIENININIELINVHNIREHYNKIISFSQDVVVLHLFSNFAVTNYEEFKIFIEKMPFINENYKVVNGQKILGVVFNTIDQYKLFIKSYINEVNLYDYLSNYNELKVNAFLDISKYNNLLTYVSGGFDARFFNSLEGNEYIVTKKSTNKNKIKQEYMYYKLLPDDMKKWMVMPYDYKENEETAQYTMERLHMTDIAIRWTHKAIDIEEYTNILKKVFYYIKNRATKQVSKQEYEDIENELYVNKVKNRIEQLKENELFYKFDMYIKSGTDYNSIDEIIEYYLKLYKKYSSKNDKYISVIGHGDLCFANMLYSRETEILKLIDPKGALTEEELWTNPYYDIAKLSHSICGNYDFFNCSSYSIELNKDLKYILDIYNNNEQYKEIFKQIVENNGYNYKLVRIYEASLFLSMLPLHMDYPQKVFAFLLNAINILKEIE